MPLLARLGSAAVELALVARTDVYEVDLGAILERYLERAASPQGRSR